VYPDYYPKEVFCSYHSREAIQADIEGGKVWVLFADGVLAGTGSREDNHVKRVFVSSAFQGKGYGSFIMQQLEDRIGEEYDEAQLDSSLCAVQLYEKRGYHTVSHEKLAVENGAILVYIVMKKDLSISRSQSTAIENLRE
jgi:GNAT superfamily N-acetyltransferase